MTFEFRFTYRKFQLNGVSAEFGYVEVYLMSYVKCVCLQITITLCSKNIVLSPIVI